MDFKFSQVCAPVFVPLTENYALNLDYIKDYYLYLKKNGINCFMINGGCGEFSSLTIEERKQIAQRWVSISDDDADLLINIGSCSIVESIELGKHALSFDKVTNLAIVPPFYMTINNEYVLLNYIKTVKDQLPTKCKILYYHIPMMSKIDINFEKLVTIMKQTNYDAISAIKFTDKDFNEFCSLKCSIKSERPFIKLYCGYELFLDKIDLLEVDGVILALVNIFPEFMSTIFNKDSDNNTKKKRADKLKKFFNYALDFSSKHQINFLALLKMICEYRSGIQLGPMRTPYDISPGCLDKFGKDILKQTLDEMTE